MTPNRWAVLAALFVARSSLGYHFQSVASVSPLLVEELGINFTQVGTLIGSFSLLGVVTALPSGMVGRRFGEGRVALGGLAIMAAGGFLMGATESFAVAAVGRVVSGVGAVTLTVVMVKLVGDLFQGREVVTALAILMNSWPVGITIGLWSQGALAEALGWQAVFLSAGAAALAGMALVAVSYPPALRPPPRAPARRSGLPGARISPREAVLASLAGCVWTLFNGGFIMVMSFGPALMVARGFDVAAAGKLVGNGTIAYMIAIPLGGWLSARLARPNLVMIAGFAAGAVTVLLVALVDAPAALFVLAGIFIGIPTGNVMALTVETVRNEHRNTGTGLYYSWHHVGLFAIPALAGWVVDLTGNPASPMYVGAAATGLAIAVLVLLRVIQSRAADAG